MADSRDMYAVHTLFRREYAALPELVHGVAPSDTRRRETVADHVQFLITLLHAHHRGEDDLLWPKLIERSTDVAPLVERMEQQHENLDRALQDAEAGLGRWRASGTGADRDVLRDAIAALIPAMVEHLDLEEAKVLPLIDRHLTHREWSAVGSSTMSKLPKKMLPVAFGMALYEADAEMYQIMKDTLPAVPFAIFSFLGPRAFARHSRRVHGTSTPPRITA
jgi:hemerythrin-like domain-containing protein